jgi:DNA-binding CsgD family transcriptional regulator
MLAGRSAEAAQLDRLLGAGVAGNSAVLVVRGEPGMGKTALLDHVAARAERWRVVRAAGVESEMELPFAGLHQLTAPLLDGLERLPAPQRDALSTAFGLSLAARPDRFLVGLAVLSLLSDAAEERPLLCVVDDAHWLDRSSAEVLAFVARRLHAESVVLLFGARDPDGVDELASLPELRLARLSDMHAREVLASVVKGPLDDMVRDRLLAETRGNPLALLELPREASLATIAGGFGLPGEQPLQGRIEASFGRRVQRLPYATQQLLLVAAAEPTGEPTLLWRAAAELGLPPEAASPAEADGLLRFGPRVAFRHPLLRSVVYRGAPFEERRTAHRALAAVTNAEADPDRRAWHRAHATLAPDEDVALELERSAGRAQARGGIAAAAAFLERAVALTPDPGRRARRALDAARLKQLSGAPEAALVLLGTVAAGPLEERDRAELQRLHGQLALDLRRGSAAVPLLLDAARRLEAPDPDLARATYLEALRAASIAGRLGPGVREAAEAAKAARRARPSTGPPRPVDLLLDGLAIRFTDGYAASAPALHRALAAVSDQRAHAGKDGRFPPLVQRVAPDLFDEDGWHDLSAQNVKLARDTGALSVLPLALNSLAAFWSFAGDIGAAAALVHEADAIAGATGQARIGFGGMVLAGWRGDEAAALAVIDAGETAASERGEGVVLTFGELSRAVLHNGHGQYLSAMGPAESAGMRDEPMASVWSLPELVEAATRCEEHDRAAAALERLAERTQAAGTDLALGIEARARALLCDGDAAERLHREAIERLSRTRMRAVLARAHLVYGEWLRRQGRRVDAREQLRTAHELFDEMGTQAFAERARRELAATGETVRRRSADTVDDLTAQEAQIARLAGDGRTNPEIGAELFISPRTVEWHLRKVYGKLGVSSRKELQARLADTPAFAFPV